MPISNWPRFGAAFLAFGFAYKSLHADVAAWWDSRWPWRRLVLVSTPRSALPGSDAAWAEIFTHGAAKPDASDVRVVTADGQVVKFFVMQSGPDDRARVCFSLTGRANKYFLYYGNAQAIPVESDWRPERGVLLEGWPYKGGAISSFAQTQQTFQNAGPLAGRVFVPNVFLGVNPFGPSVDYCHRYTGWLVCEQSGSHVFATTSKDASFLEIDGKMVVQWPGRHGPTADARMTGRVDLTRGLHKLVYHHVSIGPDGRAVAAWQPPGAPAPTVIPPGAFAPVAKGTSGDLDRYGTRFQADFDLDGPHETFFRNQYTYRYTFQARLSEGMGPDVRYEWDFGDGQTAERERVEHVYLSDGIKTVTLQVRLGGRRSIIRNRILVTRNWSRVAESKIEPVDAHARIVAGYRFADLTAADLLTAFWMLKRTGQEKACLTAVQDLPHRVGQAEPASVADALSELRTVLVDEAGRPELAVKWFESVETQAGDVALKATACAIAGRILLDELGDVGGAQAAFERALKQYADKTRSPAIRQSRIGLGDVFLRTGRYREAEEAYLQVGATTPGQKMNIHVGSYARAVDDYLRRKEFEAASEQLDRWEFEYPVEKLRGYSTLMRAELLHLQKRYRQVVRLVEGFPLVVVEGRRAEDPVDVIYLTTPPDRLPDSYTVRPAAGGDRPGFGTAFPPNPYGMEMGLLAVDAHVQLKQRDQAREALRMLIQLYPDSPLLDRAKERLKELGGTGGSASSQGGRR